jgi:hypothetical protein
MAICPSCGKDNQAHYKFCLGCGADLGEPSKAGPLPKGPVSRAAPAAKTVMADVPTRDARLDTPRPGTAPPIFADMGPGSDPVTDPSLPGLPDEAPMPAPTNGPAAGYALADAPGSRLCTTCSTLVAAGFKYCPSCGSTVAQVSSESGAPRTTGSGRPVVSNLSPSHGSLVLVRPDGTEGGSHELVDGENPIGRGMGNLFEADGYLSPVHAEMVLNAAGLVVRDTNSLNGVFVKITEEEEIFDGEIMRIGQELLRFDAIHAPEPLEDGTEILGSPNPGYWGRLAVIVGRDSDGAAYPLLGDAVILGRERGDITFPEDGYVSGTHARVSMRDGRFYLTDLNSSNGTFLRIRGERVVPTGAFVLMGQQLFRIAYQ